jgi:hypothetical protein
MVVISKQGEIAMAEIKPTPTQEENDRHALGEPITMHEPDGSPEQPTQQAAAPAGELAAQKRRADEEARKRRAGDPDEETRNLEAKKPGGDYSTRVSAPARAPAGPAPHTPAAPAKPSTKNE